MFYVQYNVSVVLFNEIKIIIDANAVQCAKFIVIIDVYKYKFKTSSKHINIGETGVHWDTGSIGTPPLVENLQHTEAMRCHFLEAWEPPLYKSIITKKIMQCKKVGE